MHKIILTWCALSLITLNTYGGTDFKYKAVKEFIPAGYEIYDTASGDFNEDGYRDYIIVLRSNDENINPSSQRPLLVLAGTAKDKFELVARNDHVVLCSTCGGVFGDPYQKVSINGPLLTVEHSVGGSWQWSRVITFRYNIKTKEILLDEDITKSYNTFSPNQQKSIASNKNDFGVLPFSSYSYNKGY